MLKIYPVIMSGGAGTRLWPLSTKKTPKQYHRLTSDLTMFEETLTRLKKDGQYEVADPIIICAADHEEHIVAQCANLKTDHTAIIIEPVARNTAAVGALAASFVGDLNPDGIILLLPADHHISDPEGFWGAVETGANIASKGYVTTLGIKPTSPETGFGYIKCGQPLGENVFEIAEFKEKPNLEVAKEYISTDEYFWNAGIFLFQASTLLDEYKSHAADILNTSQQALKNADQRRKVLLLSEKDFSACRSDSIDYAIMEKANNAAIVANVDVGWNDIGAWSSLHSLLAQKDNSTLVENGDVISIDCTNTFLRSDGPTIAAIGLEDIIVIATEDSVLITKTSESQNVKKIVETLKADSRSDKL